jgi:hypothetical protein
MLWFVGQCLWAQALPQSISGVVLDEKDQAVAGATVTARSGSRSIETQTDAQGHFSLQAPAGRVTLQVSGKYIAHQERMLEAADPRQKVELHIHYSIALVDDSIVITATTLDPIDRRNDAIYKNTLFSRDDQIFDTLAAGINASQHEGGGTSLEIRRFGCSACPAFIPEYSALKMPWDDSGSNDILASPAGTHPGPQHVQP